MAKDFGTTLVFEPPAVLFTLEVAFVVLAEGFGGLADFVTLVALITADAGFFTWPRPVPETRPVERVTHGDIQKMTTSDNWGCKESQLTTLKSARE